MRKDLKMRKGKIAAQASHASMKVFFDKMEETEVCEMEADENGQSEFPGYVFKVNEDEKEWIDGIFTKICISVNSKYHLLRIYATAKKMGLPCSLIKDAGLTEFGGVPTYTCCAIGPARSEEIDKITRDLPLL